MTLEEDLGKQQMRPLWLSPKPVICIRGCIDLVPPEQQVRPSTLDCLDVTLLRRSSLSDWIITEEFFSYKGRLCSSGENGYKNHRTFSIRDLTR